MSLASHNDPAFIAPALGGNVGAGGKGKKSTTEKSAGNTFDEAKELVVARQTMQQTLQNADVNVTAQSLRQRAVATQAGARTGAEWRHGGGSDGEDDGSLL